VKSRLRGDVESMSVQGKNRVFLGVSILSIDLPNLDDRRCINISIAYGNCSYVRLNADI
jgi:hypothetical protein